MSVLCVTVTATACSRHRTNPSGASVSFPVAPPAAYQVLQIAGDPTSGGVWFWGRSVADASVFHYDPHSKKLRRFPLGGEASRLLVAAGESGIAVDDYGTVWVGAAHTLARLDPRTGAVQLHSLPPPPGVATETTLAEIHSIAVADDGSQVAVVGASGGFVLRFTTATGRFSFDPLPQHTVSLEVAYSRTGSLAVTLFGIYEKLGHDFLQVWNGSGAAHVLPADGHKIVQTGDGFLLSGFGGPTLLVDDHATAVRPVPYATGPSVASQRPANAFFPTAPGGLVASTLGAFVVVDANGALVGVASLPPIRCPSKTPPATQSCPSIAVRSTADHDGTIWFTSTSSRSIGALTQARS
jgi:streptogramin lyase